MTKRTRIILILLCFCLAFFSVATYSFMFRTTDTKENNFEPGEVGAVIADGKVTNSGNTAAYIRIRFVSHCEDNSGNVVGIASPAITCTNANGWIEGSNNTYYYPNPVDHGDNNKVPVPLCEAANVDGYTVVLEFFAETIQANPADAATEAWGVTISNGQITSVP